MPQPTHKKHHTHVTHVFKPAYAVAAKRNVDVVSQPRHERYVPLAPKLRHVARKVWEIEIAAQVYAKQPGRTYGYVAVTRKVAINLQREHQRAHSKGCTALVGAICPNVICHQGTIIGHHHFLEKSPQHLPHAVGGSLVAESALPLHLRQQLGGSLYGAGHKLRKKTYVSKKRHCVARGWQSAAIHVDCVAQRLKCVETYAHRQYQPQCGQICVHAQSHQQATEALGKKVIVFKQPKYSQVYHQVCRHHGFSPHAASRSAVNQQPTGIAAQRCDENQQQKVPVPPAVKHIACHHHKCVLPFEPPEHKPV